MASGVLTIFKYAFLAVLYLFFLRVLRAVWVELREPKVAPVAAGVDPPGAAVADAAWVAAGPSGPPHAPAGGQALTHLLALEPAELAGQRFALTEEVTVGRAPGCAVSLPGDTFVSTLHARVYLRDGRWWVEDLGSTNGTLLNGQAVTAPAPLGVGDRLQVGHTILEMAP